MKLFRNASSKPLISIITVVRDAANEIEKTLISVMGQIYESIEYIVIDGASNDGTLDILRGYEACLSDIISERDKGLYDAMNKGLLRANGDYVLFLNAGDSFVSNESLRNVAAYLDEQNTLYFANAVVTDGHTSWAVPPRNVDIVRWAERNWPNHQATLYPKVFYKKHCYDLCLPHAADADYTVTALENLKWRHIDEDLVCFSLGGISNKPKDFGHAIARIKERIRFYGKHPERYGRFYICSTPFLFVTKYVLGKLLSRKIYYMMLKFKNVFVKSM